MVGILVHIGMERVPAKLRNAFVPKRLTCGDLRGLILRIDHHLPPRDLAVRVRTGTLDTHLPLPEDVPW